MRSCIHVNRSASPIDTLHDLLEDGRVVRNILEQGCPIRDHTHTHTQSARNRNYTIVMVPRVLIFIRATRESDHCNSRGPLVKTKLDAPVLEG
jgi:hypothetical protein